jgi:hypothetical protein
MADPQQPRPREVIDEQRRHLRSRPDPFRDAASP